MTNDAVKEMLVNGHCADPLLRAEVTDAQWADFGKTVASRIFNGEDFAYVLTHGILQAKNTIGLLGVVRAYLLTGARR